MRLTDVLNPRRALAAVAKLCVAAFALMALASLLLPFLRAALAPLGVGEALGLLVILWALSVAADRRRMGRRKERHRGRAVRRGERSPFIPR